MREILKGGERAFKAFDSKMVPDALFFLRHALCALLIICQGYASTLLVDYHVGNETGKALVCRPEMVSWHLFPSEAPVLETFQVTRKRFHEQSIT